MFIKNKPRLAHSAANVLMACLGELSVCTLDLTLSKVCWWCCKKSPGNPLPERTGSSRLVIKHHLRSLALWARCFPDAHVPRLLHLRRTRRPRCLRAAHTIMSACRSAHLLRPSCGAALCCYARALPCRRREREGYFKSGVLKKAADLVYALE